jgi:hypothetical protein
MMAKRKRYDRMDTEELAAAAVEFDRESVVAPGRLATAAERRKFNRVRGGVSQLKSKNKRVESPSTKKPGPPGRR